jgi:hypothetical protein
MSLDTAVVDLTDAGASPVAHEHVSLASEYLQRLDAIRIAGVEAILQRGEILIEAKERLDHGEWQTFCKGLPFTQRHAHRLRKIAAHPVLADRTCHVHLPDRVALLAALARLDVALLTEAIAAGQIHPRLTRVDVRTLVGKPEVPETILTIKAAMRRIERVVTSVPPAEAERLAGWLRAFAERLVPPDDGHSRRLTEQELAAHWQRMPEFVQPGAGPFKTVYVHLRDEVDMEAFSQLVGQPIGTKTKFIWYPKEEQWSNKGLRWVRKVEKALVAEDDYFARLQREAAADEESQS